ncbi:hypothetical protein U9M48_042358 [Paspalum notatum var. saurae]|uniref:Uncharacterized protein n=1 Tax=Paspalum notatum var. saurae TaxID=547442 RepID=A0AAQ3UWX2_PASNO
MPAPCPAASRGGVHDPVSKPTMTAAGPRAAATTTTARPAQRPHPPRQPPARRSPGRSLVARRREQFVAPPHWGRAGAGAPPSGLGAASRGAGAGRPRQDASCVRLGSYCVCAWAARPPPRQGRAGAEALRLRAGCRSNAASRPRQVAGCRRPGAAASAHWRPGHRCVCAARSRRRHEADKQVEVAVAGEGAAEGGVCVSRQSLSTTELLWCSTPCWAVGQDLDSKIQLDTRTSRFISCLLSTPSCLNRFSQQEFRGNLGDAHIGQFDTQTDKYVLCSSIVITMLPEIPDLHSADAKCPTGSNPASIDKARLIVLRNAEIEVIFNDIPLLLLDRCLISPSSM